jgi:hypothetical protein
MCGAGHVCPVDLYDLITRLKTTIAGHQSFWEHLLQEYYHKKGNREGERYIDIAPHVDGWGWGGGGEKKHFLTCNMAGKETISTSSCRGKTYLYF